MKLCVSIAPQSMNEARSGMREAARLGDLVEVRIDRLADPDFQSLLRKPRPPVIITNRRTDEGGHFAGSAVEQFETISSAIDAGADYVDVELRWGKKFVQRVVERGGARRVICSYHNFQTTPRNLQSLYDRCRETGANIIKIATWATDIVDNGSIFSLLRQSRRDRSKLIAFCMGEYGQISRILAGTVGGFLTFSSLKPGEATAPGQLTAWDLKKVFRIHTLGKQSRIYGLVGNPVAHSKGIYYHNRRFVQRSIDAVYINFLASHLPQFIKAYRKLFSGLSVTMPFKQEIIPLLDHIDEDARALHSVNTVLKRRGQLVGYNTDLPAIGRILRKRVKLGGKRVVVIGNGATARTMVYAARSSGAQVTCVGRAPEKARSVAREFDCSWDTLENVESLGCDVLLNGTPIGMGPLDSTSPVPRAVLRRGMVVFDAVYNPPITKLLRDAQRTGCRTISGLEFFEEQARLQSQLFLDSTS